MLHADRNNDIQFQKIFTGYQLTMNSIFSNPARRAAKIKYESPDFQVLMKGDFVTCAVTGKEIPLDDLKYWSDEHQEPYFDAAVSFARYLELKQRNKT